VARLAGPDGAKVQGSEGAGWFVSQPMGLRSGAGSSAKLREATSKKASRARSRKLMSVSKSESRKDLREHAERRGHNRIDFWSHTTRLFIQCLATFSRGIKSKGDKRRIQNEATLKWIEMQSDGREWNEKGVGFAMRGLATLGPETSSGLATM
jgi:hypothetical protein